MSPFTLSKTPVFFLLYLAISIPAFSDDSSDCPPGPDMAQINLSAIDVTPYVDFHSAALPFVDVGSTACSDRKSRPNGFWREALFSRQREHSCTDATLRLQAVFGVDLEGLPKINWAKPEHDTTVRKYVEACVTSLGSVTDQRGEYGKCLYRSRANTLSHMLGEGEVDRMIHSVGDFGPTGVAPDCAATIVRVSSGAHYLVTAAHCVIDRKRVKPNEKMWQVDSIKANYEFRAFSGWTMRLDLTKISKSVAGMEINYYEEDVAFFRIPDDVSLPNEVGIPLIDITPEPFTPIYIVGRNPYLQLLGEQDGIPEYQEPREYISITFDPRCVLLGTQRAHLYHNCQTQGGLSGGPILMFRDHQIYMAGVHAGGRRNMNAMCDKTSIPADNYGIGLVDSGN